MWLGVAASGVFFFSGCAHRKRVPVAAPSAPAGKRASGSKARTAAKAPVPPAKVGHSETGMASWYGHPYHGRQAANGEIYDMEKLVAAHRTLPFDTWVRVVNLSNQKSVEVRVIDRGPFVGGRIIDLSHAAARQIELIGPGVARVRLEVIRAPESAPAAMFAVQVGAFANKDNAERLRAQLASRYGAARLVQRADNLWHVLAGAESTEEGASSLAQRIREDSHERNAGFVVRIDTM